MNTHTDFFSEQTMARFQHELDKYPDDQKHSAVIACLSILQQEHGFVTPDHEKALAQVLEMPVMAVHEVFTFYNMFNRSPLVASRSMSAPTCLANFAAAKKPLNICAKNWMWKWVRPPKTACSLCNPANAWALARMHRCSWSMTAACAAS